MIVALEDIPNQGLDVPLGPWARSACAEGLEGSDAEVAGRLRVSRHEVHILVRGPIHGEAVVRCDRCGAEVRFGIDVELVCLYSPIDAVPVREEEEEEPPLPEGLPVSACELGEYDGARLDLAEVVRETCVVERPARILCGEVFGPEADAACRTRWVESTRSSPGDEVDPRLAVLSTFRPNSE